MMGTTHRLGGLAAGAALAYTAAHAGTDGLYTASSALIIGGAVFGSLIPDIDNKHSTISKRFAVVSLIVTVCQGLIRLLSKLLPKKQGNAVRAAIGHRGITHSLSALIPPMIGAIACNIAGKHAAFLALTGITAGMASHLLLDMFAGGAPLLSPFSAKRITIARIKTGGAVEWLVRIAAMAAIVAILGEEIMKFI